VDQLEGVPCLDRYGRMSSGGCAPLCDVETAMLRLQFSQVHAPLAEASVQAGNDLATVFCSAHRQG
jgi:hypothetical protein